MRELSSHKIDYQSLLLEGLITKLKQWVVLLNLRLNCNEVFRTITTRKENTRLQEKRKNKTRLRSNEWRRWKFSSMRSGWHNRRKYHKRLMKDPKAKFRLQQIKTNLSKRKQPETEVKQSWWTIQKLQPKKCISLHLRSASSWPKTERSRRQKTGQPMIL